MLVPYAGVELSSEYRLRGATGRLFLFDLPVTTGGRIDGTTGGTDALSRDANSPIPIRGLGIAEIDIQPTVNFRRTGSLLILKSLLSFADCAEESQ